MDNKKKSVVEQHDRSQEENEGKRSVINPATNNNAPFDEGQLEGNHDEQIKPKDDGNNDDKSDGC